MNKLAGIVVIGSISAVIGLYVGLMTIYYTLPKVQATPDYSLQEIDLSGGTASSSPLQGSKVQLQPAITMLDFNAPL